MYKIIAKLLLRLGIGKATSMFPFYNLHGSVLLLFLLLSFLMMGVGNTESLAKRGQVPPVEKKAPKKGKKRSCCKLGIGYKSGPGHVVLEQICTKKKRSVFHFRTVNVANTCIHPPATLLKDQKGRYYKLLGHSGLPPCSGKKMQKKPNTRFLWSFQRLPRSVRKVTVWEASDPITMGMGHWAWRNINVAHCKL